MARTRTRKRPPAPMRPSRSAPPPTQSSARPYIVGGRRVDGPADWRWRTFPVFFVFSLTLFLGSALCTFFASRGWYAMTALLTLIAAVPVAFALAHLVTLRYIAPHAPNQQPEDEQRV